jgi:hypothetical protein
MGVTWLQRNVFEYPLLAVVLLELASRIRCDFKPWQVVCTATSVRSRRRWRILLLGFVSMSGYLVGGSWATDGHEARTVATLSDRMTVKPFSGTDAIKNSHVLL